MLLVFFAVGQDTIVAAQTVDHTAWDILLKQFVKQGLVDYQGLRAPRVQHIDYLGTLNEMPGWLLLETYLSALTQTNLVQVTSKQEQMAFWINAYNACVFQGVLDHYPINSVKDVKGFFDKIHYEVAGASLTLNEIEAKGRALGDWRIHFGVVCASSSCPTLRSEAYVPERLEEQLADQTRRFLADPQRGLRVEGTTLQLSSIFKWYAGDFVPNARRLSPETILPIIRDSIPRNVVHGDIHHRQLTKIQYLDYDWSLNAQR